MIIKLKRGPAQTRELFIPEAGELILDTTYNILYVGDGETPGGLKVMYGDELVNKINNDGLRVNINNQDSIFTIEDFKDLI